ncbi:putative Outer membrane efflux protein; copper resistance protein B [Bradyrhizobium sp. ORS 285]|uniref:TolC family protein n=1 Tax=Bradyrhizobium sp. ORS 285 TaxID=115808 RepID=UPI0002409A95|nr:TolC family protein [Bradyrhizobium sp. ORS 285]CCD87550.1 putative Outer membrane efflux protein; copper resistance protein B [Bradyrhizobium sp. ORS 285]SMX60659.1 putative Outer membrane efflux protein; copper resistance protein B [Bradyrhizobium sp. ORS 285]
MQGIKRIAALAAAMALAGCASFSPDGGMSVVTDITARTTAKEVASVRTEDDAARVRDATHRLLARPLSADAAVQVALFNNKGLQAAFHQLALSEADAIEASLPPNPTFSLMRISGDGAFEAERQVAGDILALATLPLRSEIARERFHQAQLRAALTTVRLAAEVRRAHVRVVAANQLVTLLVEAQSAAEATAKLAAKLGETGALNRLDQAREQVFYAETTAELATARRAAGSARERLIRLMGLWGDDLTFRLPDHLPTLPRRPLTEPFIERDAVAHRIDLQIARQELTALATSLQLTEATRFVTLLDLAGLDRRTGEADGRVIRERGYDVQFQIPIFDGGEVRLRQAAETYNIAFNRLSERAVTVRSEARDAYHSYRAAYDIAGHYAREVLPLRQIISEEMQLRYSSMQVDIFALLLEARQRLASRRAAIDAVRDFFLAEAELSAAVDGGVTAGEDTTQQTASALAPSND